MEEVCLLENGASPTSDSSAFPDFLDLLLDVVDDSPGDVVVEQSEQQAVAKPSPIKNASRERLQRELVFLREHVTELEKELTSVRASKRPHAQLTDGSSCDILMTERWKETALSERTKRFRAEMDNHALHRSIENQLQIASQLSTFLCDRAAASASTATATISAHPEALEDALMVMSPEIMAGSLESLVGRLLEDVDRAYAATESVLATIPKCEELPEERTFVSTVKTRKYGNHGHEQLYIEMIDTAFRSHAYDRACEASWAALKQVYACETRVLEMGPCTQDVIAARYLAMGQTRTGRDKSLVVTYAAKKFVERDRMVIVWRTCNRPAQHDAAATPWQALSDETGWLVLSKVLAGVRCRAPGTAFMQACNRLVPVWYDSKSQRADSSVGSQLAIGEFTNVVMSATEADIMGFEKAFERLVLDDPTTIAAPPIAEEGHAEEEGKGEEQEHCEELIAFV